MKKEKIFFYDRTSRFQEKIAEHSNTNKTIPQYLSHENLDPGSIQYNRIKGVGRNADYEIEEEIPENEYLPTLLIKDSENIFIWNNEEIFSSILSEKDLHKIMDEVAVTDVSNHKSKINRHLDIGDYVRDRYNGIFMVVGKKINYRCADELHYFFRKEYMKDKQKSIVYERNLLKYGRKLHSKSPYPIVTFDASPPDWGVKTYVEKLQTQKEK